MADALNAAMERLARINTILVPRDTFRETEQNVRALVISLFKGFDEHRVIEVLNEMAEMNERTVLLEGYEAASAKEERLS
jgi:deoxyhypusine synthase